MGVETVVRTRELIRKDWLYGNLSLNDIKRLLSPLNLDVSRLLKLATLDEC